MCPSGAAVLHPTRLWARRTPELSSQMALNLFTDLFSWEKITAPTVMGGWLYAGGGCGRSLGMKEIGKRMEERRPCEGLVGDLGESSW